MIKLTPELIERRGGVGQFVATKTIGPDSAGCRVWVLRQESEEWVFRQTPNFFQGLSGFFPTAMAAALHGTKSNYANPEVFQFQSQEEMNAWIEQTLNV